MYRSAPPRHAGPIAPEVELRGPAVIPRSSRGSCTTVAVSRISLRRQRDVCIRQHSCLAFGFDEYLKAAAVCGRLLRECRKAEIVMSASAAVGSSRQLQVHVARARPPTIAHTTRAVTRRAGNHL